MLLTDEIDADLADTEANQAAYPQRSSQRKALGFPKMRLVGLLI